MDNQEKVETKTHINWGYLVVTIIRIALMFAMLIGGGILVWNLTESVVYTVLAELAFIVPVTGAVFMIIGRIYDFYFR